MRKRNTKPAEVKVDKNNVQQSKKQTKKAKIQNKNVKKSKLQKQQEQQQVESPESQDKQEQSKNDSQQSSQQNDSQQDQDDQSSEQQSSEQSLASQNYAVKQMKFRQRRGTKMQYIMNRKKDQQEDQFWKNQGNDYFGSLDDQQDDQDYEQSSSGRDQFDSDFDQTQSEHNEEEENNNKEPQQVDEEKIKIAKKQQELMRKIGAPTQKKAVDNKNIANKTGAKKSAPAQQSQKKVSNIPQVVANRYIHQVCTQQQLLGQAAQTQYINWLSLQKLISIQNQKKDFTHKQHSIEGSKIIYRNRLDQNGKSMSSYELIGINLNRGQHAIKQLTNVWTISQNYYGQD